jgi:hypothetical protein
MKYHVGKLQLFLIVVYVRHYVKRRKVAGSIPNEVDCFQLT